MLIHHITLMTGDVAVHRLDTIDPGTIRTLRQLPAKGGPIPSFAPFRVENHWPVFSVWRGQEPVVLCGFGYNTDATWQALVDVQTKIAPCKSPAPRAPWLGVVILPGLANLTQEDMQWLGDFERCYAAAMLLPFPPET